MASAVDREPAPPEESVELVRRAYAVFDTDLDRLLALVDPDVEWVSPDDAIEPGIRRGHEGVRRAFAATAMAWEDATHTPEEFAGSGDRVLATVMFRGHGRGSGMDAERREYHLWTLRDRVVVRFEWFYQREEAVEAAGMPA
jgi:ketosteroid isomerase-like protein